MKMNQPPVMPFVNEKMETFSHSQPVFLYFKQYRNKQPQMQRVHSFRLIQYLRQWYRL